MVGHNNISLLVAMLITGGLVLSSPKFAAANFFQAFDDAPVPLPEPRPGYFKTLDECSENVSPECAKEVFASIFKSGTVSNDCCSQLVLTDIKSCYDEYVEYIGNGPDFKAHLSQYLEKSDEVYSDCISRTG